MSPKKKIEETNEMELGNELLLEELQVIKKLILVLLVKLGSDSGEIGTALGIPARNLRRWISFAAVKRSDGESSLPEVSVRKKVTKKRQKKSIKPKMESGNLEENKLEESNEEPIEVVAPLTETEGS